MRYRVRFQRSLILLVLTAPITYSICGYCSELMRFADSPHPTTPRLDTATLARDTTRLEQALISGLARVEHLANKKGRPSPAALHHTQSLIGIRRYTAVQTTCCGIPSCMMLLDVLFAGLGVEVRGLLI